jgi:peroxiredoxin
MSNYNELPAGLPIPVDDGQADHLLGMAMPNVKLRSTQSREVELADLGSGRTVIYVYPMTGKPGVPLPDGWDEIPGARGCTPESCGFKDHFSELQAAGAQNVFGLSNQDTGYQTELAQRIDLPFELLSDEEGELGAVLRLPTFVIDGKALYKRLTVVLLEGRIEKVFYPIFPPDKHAQEVLAWLKSTPSQ